MPSPRENLSVYAPRITLININPDKIRDIIGPGGKVIRKIQEDTGAKIDIDDDGTVSSLGPDGGAGGLMRAFDTAASAENVAPNPTTVVGTESKGPVAADVVGAASAP